MGHVEPFGLDLTRFYCLACDTETTHEHFDLQGTRNTAKNTALVALPAEWAMVRCQSCRTVTLFFGEDQVIPPRLNGQFDFEGLPGALADEIRCALRTLHSSPRASAAHARTALYALLAHVAASDRHAARQPADVLFARLVPPSHTSMHAVFGDTCLRGGALVTAGVLQSHEPPGTASALLDLLRQARSLFFPRDPTLARAARQTTTLHGDGFAPNARGLFHQVLEPGAGLG